jgi:hypothetical protein
LIFGSYERGSADFDAMPPGFRQMFQFRKPDDIREQIREAVERLSLPEGGLMMKAEVYGADISLENAEAICLAMEEFCIGRK